MSNEVAYGLLFYPVREIEKETALALELFAHQVAKKKQMNGRFFTSLVVRFMKTYTLAARDFSARRGASDEHIPQWIWKERATKSVELPPCGLRRIWPVAAWLVGYRPTAGYAPSSRLATGQIGRNERHRIYVHDHLVSIQVEKQIWRNLSRTLTPQSLNTASK